MPMPAPERTASVWPVSGRNLKPASQLRITADEVQRCGENQILDIADAGVFLERLDIIGGAVRV